MSKYVKYPRTHHVPWSLAITNDDKVVKSMEHFNGKQVVVTEKMDGENTSLYNDYFHARSIDSNNHPSRNMVKQIHASFSHDIPEGWRVCGENVYARHSIQYDNLESYFYGFSIWDETNTCLSWDETIRWFELLGITPVRVLYEGLYDENAIRLLYDERSTSVMEGYVVRVRENFGYDEFNTRVAKFVRKDHVQTDKHWMNMEIIPNKLKEV